MGCWTCPSTVASGLTGAEDQGLIVGGRGTGGQRRVGRVVATLVRVLCGLVVLAGIVGPRGPAAARKLESPSPSARPASAEAPGATAPVPQRAAHAYRKLYRVCRVTAYCDRGLTAAGVPAGVGQCAAPIDIPFGAHVYIPVLERAFVVTDRTARRFRHNTVDIFLPQRRKCLEFGRQYLECEITLPDQTPRYGSTVLRAAVAAAQRGTQH